MTILLTFIKLLFEESYFKQSLPYLVQIQLLSHHVLSNPFGEVGYPGVDTRVPSGGAP